MSDGWIGVDLDGTLAVYDHWRGEPHIGEPIPAMVERVQGWLEAGREVRIVTARVGPVDPQLVDADYPRYARTVIEDWCLKHLGRKLEVTCQKDFGMIELWDDRAVSVETNTGRRTSPLVPARGTT